MSIANYLTFIRLLISPIFMLIYLNYTWFGISMSAMPIVLLVLWIISEISDAFDGYLARKFNQVTDLGKLLDPMADSIYRLSALLAFTQPPINLNLIIVFIFFYRDALISTLRTICALKGHTLAARSSGKIKAILQAAVTLIILGLLISYSRELISLDMLSIISNIIVGITALYAIFSGVEYIYASRYYIQCMLKVK